MSMNNNWSSVLFDKRDARFIALNDPKLLSGQVRVKIHYTALCGTQLGEWDENRGQDKYLPHCFGHEAVGTVIEIKKDVVTSINVGDNVVVSWIKNQDSENTLPPKFICAESKNSNLTKDINSGICCTFTNRAIVSVGNLTKIDVEKILPIHSLLGCALLTAYANVVALEQRGISTDQPIAIWGLGGIGLCTALLLGAKGYKTLGIDPNINLGNDELSQLGLLGVLPKLNERYYEQFTCSIVTVGSNSAIVESQSALKKNSGILLVSGNLPNGQYAQIDLKPLLYGRALIGVGERFLNPQKDIPIILGLISKIKSIEQLLIDGIFDLSDMNKVMLNLSKNGGKRKVFSLIGL